MCRSKNDGGRRCPACTNSARRNAADRARRLLTSAGARGVAEQDVIYSPPSPAVGEAALPGYSDTPGDEVDLDGNPVDDEAPVKPEAESQMSSWVGSTADIHRLLAGFGAHGSMVMVGSWKRTAAGELAPHQHAELGRTQRISGVWRSHYDIGDGQGTFEVGRPENWNFADGIGTFTSGTIATAWLFTGQATPTRPVTIQPGVVQRRTATAVSLIADELATQLNGLTGQNPGEAFAGWTAAAAAVIEKNRVLDASEMASRRLTAREWQIAREREFPELTAGEIKLNDAYLTKFTRGLSFAEKKLTEYRAARRSTHEVEDSIEDLTAAVRGLEVSGRILRERQARAGA